MTVYRNFNIYYAPPPIPSRNCDWHWTHEDYDGDEDNRYGHAESEEAAKGAVDEWHFDRCKCSSADPLDCMAWTCANRDAARTALQLAQRPPMQRVARTTGQTPGAFKKQPKGERASDPQAF